MQIEQKFKQDIPVLRNKQFWSIFSIAFLIYFSNNMLAQTLPKYAYDLGASAQIIGVTGRCFCGMCTYVAASIGATCRS